MQETAPSPTLPHTAKATGRVVGVDAARGLALMGMLAAHIFPNYDEDTGEPTLAFVLFAGDSAALFVLLAGVGLALSTGGRNRHRGRRLRADQVGLAARAVLVGIVALIVAAIIQGPDVETSILLYFAVFFVLAIPFLALGARALFACAAVFSIAGPFLMFRLTPALPEWSDSNPSLPELFSEPVAVLYQLLLTGTYPALPYLTFLLVGMGLGRLDLGSLRVRAWMAGTGAGLAVLANTASWVLLSAAGGYQRLLGTPGMTKDDVDDALVFGPETIPDSSPWWLAITAPHTNTPLALASSLGIALAVLGVVLLVAPRAHYRLYPLEVTGAMTMTLYTSHLLALSLELHYDEPVLWYLVHLLVAFSFAMVWTVGMGMRQGPLETAMKAGAQRAKRLVPTEPAAAPARPSSAQEAGPAAEPHPAAIHRPSAGAERPASQPPGTAV
ncbi:MAG: heparan-alpha-glucosaminide N-acetyltransferase domain-containing protein [Micrococcus sp.]|nr:heparan-alpha-glucosaminide N-acetyltransferase domain-containing protein [Micrococcus sp.]